MEYLIIRKDERGLKQLEWLQSNFLFSFSSYYNPARSGLGLLRVFNDDYVKPGQGFGLHPHVNMEIISIMLQGNMNHKDSMGYSEVVSKDWVQIMSAGTGLRHEEYNVGEEEVNFLQIWIEPKLQNITPRYQRRQFPEEQRHNRLVTVVSNEEGQGHCWINQNARIKLGYFDAGNIVEYAFQHTNKCLLIYVISGSLEIAGQQLQERDAMGIWNTGGINITCTSTARFAIVESPINH
ncbi:pirin family protein [Chitinophaga pendula]|uniref:pirin family protein n=1 Tax=Chitinophaga TaxID=79328 RepID=UPI000BAF9A0F|nr:MULTISPECIES: pirin-like bicupin family protein [Chitinophaga]ASZ12380.1 pirin family protein [Chitinophaga sp. MD30]UCJ10022.1 pirin family protein [Chitinophaga pendula]